MAQAHTNLSTFDPFALGGPQDDACAYRVYGDAMAPRYENGDTLGVYPSRLPKNMDDVIIVYRPEPGEPEGRAILKRLVTLDDEKVVVLQYNPPETLQPIPTSQIERIYVVRGRVNH